MQNSSLVSMISNFGGRQEKRTPHMMPTNSLTSIKLLCIGIQKLKSKTKLKQTPANGYTTNCHLSSNVITRKHSHGNLNARQCSLEVMLPHSNHFVIFYQMTTQRRRWRLLRFPKFPMVRKMTAIKKGVSIRTEYLQSCSHFE